MSEDGERGKSVGFGLLVAFPDQSRSFVHGYEAGEIAHAMKTTADPIERTVHTANVEVLRRMGAAFKWSVELTPCEADFDPDGLYHYMKATPGTKPKLRVV